jgi:nucleotide-binding universal stress UspA family protein
MKNILVPTDFSECALNAIKFAADLSRKMNSTIHVAHIHQRVVPSDTTLNIDLDSKIVFREKEVFKNYIKELKQMAFMKDVKLKTSLDTVFQLEDVLVMDKYENVDLIVMGSHVIDGIEEFFIGSNTQKFIQLAHCPVISIKEEVKISDIKSIVFASDFKKEVLPKFEVIKNFARKIGAKLHYLKIMTPKDYSAEQQEMTDIAEFVKITGINPDEVNLFKAVSIERGIIKYCREAKASMLAIETHGKTGLSHLLQDNIAESLSNHMVIPLFSVKIEEERRMLTDTIVDFLTKKNLIFKKQNYG